MRKTRGHALRYLLSGLYVLTMRFDALPTILLLGTQGVMTCCEYSRGDEMLRCDTTFRTCFTDLLSPNATLSPVLHIVMVILLILCDDIPPSARPLAMQ